MNLIMKNKLHKKAYDNFKQNWLIKSKNILKQIVVFVVCYCLLFQTVFYEAALANPSNIVPDGSTGTTVDVSPNNITVVNIAKPTDSGTSINNFNQYNVDQSGAIINNSNVIVNTELGGVIYANPHLANGQQATVIVGEVTGSMPSQLLGYTEIAGGKAELILLNPNGIMCQGCGFINTNSLTLGTGSANYNLDGSLASVNMGAGTFAVAGKGLDASLVDYFRIISKNVQLSAPIWAKNELEIYQGSSNFNTTTNKFSGVAKPNSGQTVGIDASLMGAMYAGKATLIASDLGLGVNIASDVIASKEGITIKANGDIVYNNISSVADININANNNGSITQNGSVKSSSGNINFMAERNIIIAGGSLSSSNINLTAKDFKLISATLSAGQISVMAANNVVTEKSQISSDTVLLLSATNTIENSDSKIQSLTDSTIKSASLINKSGTLVNANGNLNIESKSIINDGSQIYSLGNQSLVVNSLTNNNSSLIYSGGLLSINNINNSNLESFINFNSNVYAVKNLNIQANTLKNTNASLVQTKEQLNIVAEAISNEKSSQFVADGNTNIKATSLQNIDKSLIVTSGNLVEAITGNITQNNSQTVAKGEITINANSVTNENSSVMQTGDVFNVNLVASLNNTGKSSIITTLNGMFNVDSINNTTGSSMIIGGDFASNSSKTVTNAAQLLVFGNIAISNLNNQNGNLEAGKSLIITNNTFALNNMGGIIQADGGNVSINSNYQVNSTNGQINSANDINLNIQANQNYNDSNSQINAVRNIYINSAGYDVTKESGVNFKTSNLLQVNAATFINNADINVGYIEFNLSNQLINNANLVSKNDSQYIVKNNIENRGTIASGAGLLLQGANIKNTHVGGSTGLIYSGKNMLVAAGSSIDNQANSAIVSRGTLGIHADTLIVNGVNAQIWSVGNLTLGGYGNNSVATFNNGSTDGAAYLKSNSNMYIFANQVNNVGKDNASLDEGNAYTVSWAEYDVWPSLGDTVLKGQEIATNILTSTNSQIVAGGSILINGNVNNQTADILAGGDIVINGNVTNTVTHYKTRALIQKWVRKWEECFWGIKKWCKSRYDWWDSSYMVEFSSLTPSRIAAGNNLVITGSQITNDSGSATFQNNTPLGGSTGGTNSGYQGSYGSSFTNSNNLNTKNLSSPEVELKTLSNPALFKVSESGVNLNLTNANGQNVSFTYLYESNPVFREERNFLTSEYFFERLGYAPSKQMVMIGDPYTERRIIEDTIAKTGMVQYLGNGAIDALYANGLAFLEGKTTKVGYALTEEQINNLEKDVIIPVEREIDGKIVMVPQVYYSKNTLDKLKEKDVAGGQIYAGKDVSINAKEVIINGGYIASGGTLSLTSDGDILNIGGTLSSGSNMILKGNDILLDALVTNNTTPEYIKTTTRTVRDYERGYSRDSSRDYTERTVTTTEKITDEAKSNQVQNVSKVSSGGSVIINANNNFVAKGASIKALEDVDITAGGSVLLTAAYSKGTIDGGEKFSETSSKSVNTIIQTGTEDGTGKLIEKLKNDKIIENKNLELADLRKQREDVNNSVLLNRDLAAKEEKLKSLDVAIEGKEKEVAGIKEENKNLLASIANKSGGDVSIKAGKDVSVIAGVDEKTSHSSYTHSSFLGSEAEVKNSKTQQVISGLVSGNNVNISANNDVNVLASVITGGGSGSISANNNISIASLENTYYSYEMHQKTSIDVQALAVQLAATIAVAVVTAGAGAVLLAGAGAALTATGGATAMLTAATTAATSTATMTAAGAAATAAVGKAAAAVGVQYAISVGLSGGEGGTQQIQSGDATITIKTSNTLIASSLLFKEELNVKAGNNVGMQTANIKSSNMEQETKQSSSTSLVVENIEIEADYKGITKGAIITGTIVGLSTAVSNYLGLTTESGKDYSTYKPDEATADKFRKVQDLVKEGKMTTAEIAKQVDISMETVEVFKNTESGLGNLLKQYVEDGITDKFANNIGRATTTSDLSLIGTKVPTDKIVFLGEGGTFSKTMNSILGMNSMATNIHDGWGVGLEKALGSGGLFTTFNIATIPPAIAVHSCLLFAGVCGGILGGPTTPSEVIKSSYELGIVEPRMFKP